jgi:hypothetical protein
MKTFNQFFEDLGQMVNRGLARATDPETAKEAAQSVDPTKLEQIVLDTIRSFPSGCISQDVEHMLAEYRASSITPRYRPLMKKGLIVDTGEKRPGFSGRNQRVMKAV